MHAVITKTIIEHDTNTVHCYYRAESGKVVAHNQHSQFTQNDAPLDKAAWTDEDVRAALAALLGITVDAVTTAAPAEPEPSSDETLAEPEE